MDDSPLEDPMLQATAPEHIVQALRGCIDAQPLAYCVWPEHWHAVMVFQGMADQWRVVNGAGGLLYLGLDYAALPPVLAEHRAVAHRQPMDRLMPQLRVLAAAARAHLNDR